MPSCPGTDEQDPLVIEAVLAPLARSVQERMPPLAAHAVNLMPFAAICRTISTRVIKDNEIAPKKQARPFPLERPQTGFAPVPEGVPAHSQASHDVSIGIEPVRLRPALALLAAPSD